MIIAMVLFLFFCLFLDAFCFLFLGGWQPLVGKWPIFSGSISLFFYADPWKVLILVLGMGGLARILIGKSVPGVVGLAFGLKEPGLVEIDSEENVER